MKQSYKNCQSCGMPLKKSPNGNTTNSDNSISLMYCVYCFENGVFKQPDLTVEQMQELAKEKMKGMGFPRFLASFFTKRIPKLKRWQTEN